MANKKPTTIDEYILAAPPQSQEKLMQLRSILREVAPDATEQIKWGYPVMEQKRILFSFAAFKSHINFMPTGPTIAIFKAELAGYKTGKDTIQLTYDKPLPAELIRKIAAHRLKDVLENDAKWMY
jgi:uncharacterized protein YdhG (YjbR/CyaY superfamily)